MKIFYVYHRGKKSKEHICSIRANSEIEAEYIAQQMFPLSVNLLERENVFVAVLGSCIIGVLFGGFLYVAI